MPYEELIDLLSSRNALIVHCSRPGKGDEGRTVGCFPMICAMPSRFATPTYPTNAGTVRDTNGRRTGLGTPYSRQAVTDTFTNSTDYNEWTVMDADTIGIFINLQDPPREVAKIVDFTQLPDYNSTIMASKAVIPQPITLEEACAAFPDLPVYGFLGTEIIQIGIEAKVLYK